MRTIRLILPRGCVTKSNLVLVVQPVAIMRTPRYIHDSLHEAALHACLVLVIGLAVRLGEPMREVRLRADNSASGIDHGLRFRAKQIGMAS